MDAFLSHPAVQGGIAPFLAGLIVVAILARARLAGLAVATGFAVAVALVDGLGFTPLTATRKLVLLGLLAPAVGIFIGFIVGQAGRSVAVLVALACGALSPWVFWSVLRQQAPATALALGLGTAVWVAWLVASTMNLAQQPVRAGAASVTLGLATGISAILVASAKLGLYGISLAAGAGAFLLWQMATGRKIAAGATLMLSIAVAAGLLAAAAMILAQLPWYALIPIALIPLAARLPAAERLPVFVQACVVSAYGLALAAVACVLTWRAPAPLG